MFVFIAVLTMAVSLSANQETKYPVCALRNLEQVYQWSVLKYATPPGYTYPEDYVATNSFISGVEVIPSGILIATPREATISPATLSIIPIPGPGSGTASPTLQPYPNISVNTIDEENLNCNTTLVSVQRMARDKCNRLWTVDYGVVNNFVKSEQKCPPKIVIFNLTNSEMKIVPIPSSVVDPLAILSSIVLDDVVAADGNITSCDDLFAYIADTTAAAIIVYRGSAGGGPGSFHKVTHPFMAPDPDDFLITVQNEVTTFFQGIIGLDVARKGVQSEAYFQAVASKEVNVVATAILQNPPPGNNPNRLGVRRAFRKESQGTGLYVDTTDGCVIFNPISQGSIVGWNPTKKIQRTLARNSTSIIIVEDFNQANPSTTYATSWAIQKILNNNVNPQEINGFLLRLNVIRGLS